MTPTSAPHPPRAPDAEVLLWSVGIPECPFTELGLVTVHESWFSQREALMEVMKEEARLVGGHALVGLRDFHKAEGEGGGSWGLSATIIRFTEPGCMR